MGYIDIMLYFCCAIKTVIYLSNSSWSDNATTCFHPMSTIADTPPPVSNNAHAGIIPHVFDSSLSYITAHLPIKDQYSHICYIDIYVNSFIELVQGGGG